MHLLGVDVNDLEDDFGKSTSGKTLILDGDGPAYVAAATVKTVPTGVRRFHTAVLTSMFLADCSDAAVFLTASGSFKAGRYNVLAQQPYQGQRTGPKPPLLNAVREAAAAHEPHEDFSVSMEHIVEADDAMMMLSYVKGESGVMRSEDKDLRMTPFPYWDIKRGILMPSDPFGELWLEYTPSGSPKLVGRSLKFFWAQMMMGDGADHIKGLVKFEGKNCGLQTTYDVLHPLSNIYDVSNCVIDAYRKINQNPLPEAWLLWMLRSPTDNVWKYLCELEWSLENMDFLQDCVRRPWFTTPKPRGIYEDD